MGGGFPNSDFLVGFLSQFEADFLTFFVEGLSDLQKIHLLPERGVEEKKYGLILLQTFDEAK